MFIRKEVTDLGTNNSQVTTIVTEPVEDIWTLLNELNTDCIPMKKVLDCD